MINFGPAKEITCHGENVYKSHIQCTQKPLMFHSKKQSNFLTGKRLEQILLKDMICMIKIHRKRPLTSIVTSKM